MWLECIGVVSGCCYKEVEKVEKRTKSTRESA